VNEIVDIQHRARSAGSLPNNRVSHPPAYQ
jgi:hypothetical protein